MRSRSSSTRSSSISAPRRNTASVRTFSTASASSASRRSNRAAHDRAPARRGAELPALCERRRARPSNGPQCLLETSRARSRGSEAPAPGRCWWVLADSALRPEPRLVPSLLEGPSRTQRRHLPKPSLQIPERHPQVRRLVDGPKEGQRGSPPSEASLHWEGDPSPTCVLTGRRRRSNPRQGAPTRVAPRDPASGDAERR